jgi:Uma2 family endonuclease
MTAPKADTGIMAGGPDLRTLQRRADLMGMAAPTYYTAEMVRALPDDGQRYETVHGELLVTPAPRELHQRVLMRLIRALGDYLEGREIGAAYLSPADISWGPSILVQPDLFVAPLDEARTGDWRRMRSLLLVIEVLSPSTSRYDRFTKRRLYQDVGVPAYWVVDAETQELEVWTPDATFPTLERERVEWRPAGDRPPFVLDLRALFRPL